MNKAVFYLDSSKSMPYLHTFMHALEMAGFKPRLATEDYDSYGGVTHYLCYTVEWEGTNENS